MALMDHGDPIFPHHPIIPIPCILLQPIPSPSEGMLTFPTFDLLNQPRVIPHPLVPTMGAPFHIHVFHVPHVLVFA